MKKLIITITYTFSLLLSDLLAQDYSKNLQTKESVDGINEVNWKPIKQFSLGDKTVINFSFEQAIYSKRFNEIPYFIIQFEKSVYIGKKPLLNEIATEPLTEDEKNLIVQNNFQVDYNFIRENYSGVMRNIKFQKLHICPIKLNKQTGEYEKLLRYSITWQNDNGDETQNKNSSITSFANSSVLSAGTWYKMAIPTNGIYKIDKNFLIKLGVDVSSLNTNKLSIFGNGGRILPEKNSARRFDDLNEIAIKVVDGNDGKFDDNDYILFYGVGSHQWDYKKSISMNFTRTKNYYSDSAFYFLNIDNNGLKRIQNQTSSATANNYTVNSFDDYAVHEIDAVNLVKSGRETYGEYFDIATSYSFNFPFSSLVLGDTIRLSTSIAGRNTSGFASFQIDYPTGNFILNCPQTGSSYTDDIAKESTGFSKFLNTSTGNINITVSKITPQASGWLNYISLNVRRQLTMNGDQMAYRDSRAIGKNNIALYQINSNIPLSVWDVTDPFNVKEQSTNYSSGNVEYKILNDTLKEFVAYTGKNYFSPTAMGPLPNQNLHATQPLDYIIVTHPLFKKDAQKLAQLHSTFDNLTSVIVTTDEIYNEFSSGAQDITAIRDFVRMLYKRATTGNLPKYLLLFGDGSYDNLNRYSTTNTNFIPTYQRYSSISFMDSYTSDDFYGFMDDNEGDFLNSDIVDIGVGRIPASSVNEADAVTNKIFNYYKKDPKFNPSSNINSCIGNNESPMGDWRNWICFIADDPDQAWEKTFVTGSESYSAVATSTDKTYNIDKIYCDAFKQETTPGGERYPEVNEAINNRMDKGALIINYSGHGGELGWGHEAILDVGQILGWKNLNNMPMFLTATCEFSRYDDPGRTSAGEYILLNANGGGIGLLTTTRIAYASDADVLCPDFFNTALKPMNNGKMPAVGDIIRLTKNLAGPGYRHFTLLGDPALFLAYPKNKVFTTVVNQHNVVPNVNDTIAALQKVTIKGYVGDASGTKISSYNGVIYPTVFDKSVNYSTLGNNLGASAELNFKLQKNVLYKGKASVTSGDFEFSFIVPKDISYHYGPGRISYYIKNDTIDGAGYFENIVIGGSDPNAKPDLTGPEVKLFLNDNKFVYGGITNENPKLYAELFDSSGINTVGNGIGHDLVAILDANTSKAIILNDYYQSDLNDYQSGKILYPYTGLAEGNHTLSLKVWDVQNNSSSMITEFTVASSAELALKHIINYPNPFTTNTKFYVEHNQCCTNLNLEIQIFTVSGKIVKTINKYNLNHGFRTDGVEWDGKDDYGDKIGKGVYIYRVSVKDNSGKKAEKFEKLVILN